MRLCQGLCRCEEGLRGNDHEVGLGQGMQILVLHTPYRGGGGKGLVALHHGKLAQCPRRNDKRQFRSVELGIHQLGFYRIRHIPHLCLGGCLLKDEAGDITYGGNTAEKGTSPIGFQGALSLHTDVVQAHVLVSGRTVLHLCTERFALFACPGTNPRIGNGLGVVVTLGAVPDGTVQDALVTDAEADRPVAGSGFGHKTQGHFSLFIRNAGH